MDKQNTTRINRAASPGLSFLFSLIPGGGHMYLGMMRRGTELMAIFFASIFIVTVALGLSEIGVPLFIITFFYSLFDAQHINKAIRRGEIVQDQNIFFKKDYGLNGYHYGLIAIVLGLMFLINRLERLLSDLMPYRLYYIIQRSFTPLIIIGLGLYLLLKSSKDSKSQKLDQSSSKIED